MNTNPHDLPRRRLLGLAGAVTLVAVVVGGPFLLLRLGGNPLPGRIPSIDDLAARLTGPDNGELLLWALTVLGWFGWAIMTSSILLELGSQLTGRRTPRLPGLDGPQRLASLVVAATLAALSAPTPAAHAAYIDPAPAVQTVAELPTSPAEQPEPLTAHAGELLPTQQPQLAETISEAPAQMAHEVAKGDWMWHIAGRYLGDELRYPEIAELNPEYAARHPNYPDHIEPGDQLLLPEDARDRGPRPHATGSQTVEQPATGGDLDADERAATPEPDEPVDDTPAATPPTAADAGPPAAQELPPDNVDTDPGTAIPLPDLATAAEPEPMVAQPPDELTGVPAAADAPADGSDQDNSATAGPTLAPLAAVAVLCALLLGGMLGYRRLRNAHRRRGHMVASLASAEAEADLRAGATADVSRLDQALRALAAAYADAPDRLPDIGAVWLTDDDIHLILANQYLGEPPPPFITDGLGIWTLPGDATLPELENVVSPWPALVTVGTEPGRHLLVDLERIGMTTITGPSQRVTDLLRYFVAELAHNTWSDLAEVTLAGFDSQQAEALVAFNPARISATASIPDAVAALRRRLTHTSAALDRHGLTDAVQGRVGDTAADTWIPQLLLIAEPDPAHDHLLAELEQALTITGRRCAVAVVTTRPSEAYGSFPLTVTEDGLLRAGFLDDSHDLPAAALPERLLAALSALMHEAAEGGYQPIPAAQEPWAAGTDATGRLISAPTSSLLADTPLTPLPAVTAVARDELDEALTRWREESDPAPQVAVLGPIQVTADGPKPPRRRRACQELVVFLAARGEAGATAAEISQNLWPQQDLPATVRNDVIASTRRWLGYRPDGEPWLREADAEARYRLDPAVPVDWFLFRRLRARGESRGATGMDDLRAALSLVRGAPLHDADRPALGVVRPAYTWLPGTCLQPELVLAGVTDTAHELVEVALAAGDLATARWAVGQAWLADPHRSDDHPWRDLLRIAHAADDHDELHLVVTDLLRHRDAEHPDELSSATAELITELSPVEHTGYRRGGTLRSV